MADKSKIEWTDATWNPITGCSVTSPGCTGCYAMRLAGGRLKNHPSRKGLTQESKAGPVWTGEVRFNREWLNQPLTWKKPRMVFVCAHADLFHEAVPEDWIVDIWANMALARQHVFQVLTKRHDRMWQLLSSLTFQCRVYELYEIVVEGLPGRSTSDWTWPIPNAWVGVSVESQDWAAKRIPLLMDTPAAVRWISAEPLLGPINLTALETIAKHTQHLSLIHI